MAAITHPATVAALGVLLLNDLLLKSLWQHSWITGKLSDLAWLVIAMPLLAVLISLPGVKSHALRKGSFITAYAGLPMLYAAFNTFEPVHYWILRGISLVSGGTAGSPQDITDSMVIPLACALALWVWNRPVPAAGTWRLRLGLLVAGMATLASVATSYPEPEVGVHRVGISSDRTLYASAGYFYTSTDGGLSWSVDGNGASDVNWGGDTAKTPLATYTLRGPHVMRVGSGLERVVYSASYLQQDGNVWVQEQSTSELGVREIATEPVSIVYDETTGNLIVAMGIQGVVVGKPNGEWRRVAVGSLLPTDFSFMAKNALLLSDLSFWTAVSVLSLSMTGSGLILSQNRGRSVWTSPNALRTGAAILGVAILTGALALVGGMQFIWLLATPILLMGPIGAAFAIGAMPRESGLRAIVSLAIGVLAVLSSCVLLALFGPSSTEPGENSELQFIVIAVVAVVLAAASLVASWQLFRHWKAITLSLAGMMLLTILPFMLWLHIGIDRALAAVAAFAFTGLSAVALSKFIGVTADKEAARCPNCQVEAEGDAQYCANCGEALDSSASRSWISATSVTGMGHTSPTRASRFGAAIFDYLLVYIVVNVCSYIYSYVAAEHLLSSGDIWSSLVTFTFFLMYGTVLIGAYTTTAGKRMLNIRVVRTDGSRVSFGRAFLRELAKFPPLLIVSAWMVVLREDRRGIHDLVADTVVVGRESSAPRP